MGKGGGSTTVQAPQPSAEERALQKQQTELLKQQQIMLEENRRQQELLAPIIYKSSGVEPIYGGGYDSKGNLITAPVAQNPSTAVKDLYQSVAGRAAHQIDQGGADYWQNIINTQGLAAAKAHMAADLKANPVPPRNQITGYREIPPTPQELQKQQLEDKILSSTLKQIEVQERLLPQQEKISTLQNERSLAALRGELPVDPSVTRGLQESEAQLRDQLFRNLGSGYETSTPGIQALAEFNKRKQETLSGASRGELALSEQFGLARQNAMTPDMTNYLNSQQLQQGLKQSRFGNLFQTMLGPTQSNLGGYQQIAQGYQGPIGWLQNNRQQQLNASISNAQSAAQAQAGFGSLIGAGMIAGATIY